MQKTEIIEAVAGQWLAPAILESVDVLSPFSVPLRWRPRVFVSRGISVHFERFLQKRPVRQASDARQPLIQKQRRSKDSDQRDG